MHTLFCFCRNKKVEIISLVCLIGYVPLKKTTNLRSGKHDPSMSALSRHGGTLQPKRQTTWVYPHLVSCPDLNLQFYINKLPCGFIAITDLGVLVNPWTKKPFSSHSSCRGAVIQFLRHKRWPGKEGFLGMI